MKNFKGNGTNVPLTAPYAVTSGGGFLVGSLFAVASAAAALGEIVAGATRGVFDLAKATGEAWTVGAKIYWDNTNKRCTTTASGNTLIGVALATAASGDTVGTVRLGIVA
ncbi:MAG: DUF2190 family protein [Sphingobium sp.]|nr:DUF2190 family protein [Sphingobium sp.]MBP8671631.1 DUF2190 family protein [Sphingobium sp.]MBP9158605.1 DUF2190 family protein [Sphingobium sp.]